MNSKIIATLCLMAWLCACSLGPDEKVKTVRVVKRDMVNEVAATGTLRSANSALITPPRIPDTWNFTISFMAPEGKKVSSGTPILRFDTKRLQERLQLIQAELASNRKTLEKIQLEEKESLEGLILDDAQKEVDLAKASRKIEAPEDFISLVDMAKLRKDFELAQAQKEMSESKVKTQTSRMKRHIEEQEQKIQTLEKELNELQTSIEAMTVKATKDGLVVYRENWRGEKPAVGDTIWLGRELLELPDLSMMQVSAVIDEPDAGRVKVGQEVEIRLDANPDKVFMGKIESLGRIFRKRSYQKPSVVFDAIVSIARPDPEIMRPGMAAKLRILIERSEAVLQLPENAITYYEGKPHVSIPQAFGKAQLKPIEIGRRSAGFIEILSGLKEGEEVAIPNGEGEAS